MIRGAGFVLFGLALAAALRAAPAEPALVPDPSLVRGTLPNGLRYVVAAHPVPRHTVSLALLVQVGSYQEGLSERGYAHFVEHLVFDTTPQFPGDGLVRTLQRMGIGFGPHVNADTSFFQTYYRIENIPLSEPGAFATGLSVLRAMAGDALFTDAAVRQERRIIDNEGAARSGMMAELWDDGLEYLPPDEHPPRYGELRAALGESRLAHRPPIGDERTVRSATPAALQAFYRRWYRPERMVLAVAGDVDAAAVVAALRPVFGSLAAAAGPASPDPPHERPLPNHVHVEELAGEPQVRLAACGAVDFAGPDTPARRRQVLARKLALSILARRLDVASAAGAPFFDVDVLVSHFVPSVEIGLVRVKARPEAWQPALSALCGQLARMRRDGIAPEEFTEAVRARTLLAEGRPDEFFNLTAGNLARQLAFGEASGLVPASPEAERDLERSQLASLTAADCVRAFRELFPEKGLGAALSGTFPGGSPPARLIDAAMSAPPEASASPQARSTAFPYVDFGPAGAVAESRHDPLLDADLFRFANGVGLDFKRTGFERGRVRVAIRFRGGRAAAPPPLPGLDQQAGLWIAGGLEGLTAEQERSSTVELSDGNCEVTFGPTFFGLTEECGAARLPLALEWSAAHFTHPAFRLTAAANAAEMARGSVAPHELTAEGRAGNELLRMAAGSASPLPFPSMAQAAERTPSQFLPWFRPLLASAPIEIAVVGDVDREAVVSAVARTFGALPARGVAGPERLDLAFARGPMRTTIKLAGKQQVAAVGFAWFASDLVAPEERAQGWLLAAVLEDRLRQELRVKMGKTYSPDASFECLDGFHPDAEWMRCVVVTEPHFYDVGPIERAIRRIVADLAASGPAADELERARAPLVQEVVQGRADNRFWLSLLESAQELPREAAAEARSPELLGAATLADVKALAAHLFAPARQFEVVVKP